MMMKRLFTLCLAMVMALSLAACGTSKTPTTSSTPADTSVEPTSTGHPAFHAGSNSKQNLTAKDGTEVLVSKSTAYDIVYPEASDAQKAIQKDLEQVVADFHKDSNKQEEDAQTYYQEFLKGGGKKEAFTPYTFELTCKPLRADNNVVSILFYSYQTRSSFTSLIFASYSMSWSVRCDHSYIHIFWRCDASEVDVESVCEHQHVTFLKVWFDVFLIHISLFLIIDQNHDDISLLSCFCGCINFKTF